MTKGRAVSSTPPVQSTKNTLSIIAIVCGVAAVILPVLFGPVGIVLSAFAMRNGERLSKVALGAAIGGTVLGVALLISM
jgi:hypothetical protein